MWYRSKRNSRYSPPLPLSSYLGDRANRPPACRTGSSLAHLDTDLGRYAEAEPLSQRALAIREKALGPEHPDVASTLENYASLLRKMDRPEEAEPLEARARAIRAK